MAEASNSNPSSKRLPKTIMELVDLAVFSFSTQSGLRATHKVRGDPIVEGVCTFFGDLLSCANQETRDLFDAVTEVRLGGWQPGDDPTKEMKQMISSRMYLLKSKDYIREKGGPKIADILCETIETYDEALDRVNRRYRARCWRCQQPCRFCQRKKKWDFVKTFRADWSIPFLDALEKLLDDSQEDDEEEDDETIDEMLGFEDPGYAPADLYNKLTKDEEITDSDDDEDEKDGGVDEPENDHESGDDSASDNDGRREHEVVEDSEDSSD